MLFGLPRSWERQLGWFSETGNGRSPAEREGRRGGFGHKRPEPEPHQTRNPESHLKGRHSAHQPRWPASSNVAATGAFHLSSGERC